MFVKPAKGVNVRNPDSMQLEHIPATGAEVPESTYWNRRLKSGDVVRCAPPVVSLLQIPDSKPSK